MFKEREYIYMQIIIYVCETNDFVRAVIFNKKG